MISFACPSCGMALSAPEDCAGRSTKCRGCNGPIVVPQVATTRLPQQPAKLPVEKPRSPQAREAPNDVSIKQRAEPPDEAAATFDVLCSGARAARPAGEQPMPSGSNKTILPQRWKYVSPSFLVLCLILFPLPWVEIRCNGTKEVLVSQSGLQAIYGGWSSRQGGSSSALEAEKIKQERMSKQKEKEFNIFDWILGAWAPLMVVYSILLLYGAMVGFLAPDKTDTDKTDRLKGFGMIALLAFFTLLIQVGVGFPVERQIHKGDEGIVVAKYTAWFWAVMVFNLLAILAAGLEWFATRIYRIWHSSA